MSKSILSVASAKAGKSNFTKVALKFCFLKNLKVWLPKHLTQNFGSLKGVLPTEMSFLILSDVSGRFSRRSNLPVSLMFKFP